MPDFSASKTRSHPAQDREVAAQNRKIAAPKDAAKSVGAKTATKTAKSTAGSKSKNTAKSTSENTSKSTSAGASKSTSKSTSAAPVRPRVRHKPETRAEMLERLTNPLLSLHEASVLLRVCPATVRRYTDSGVLPHVRTAGRQRRFRLRDVLLLLRQTEARRKK